MQGSEFRVQGRNLRVWVAGIRVWGAGCRVKGAGSNRGGAVHGHDALERQEVVHHRERPLLHLPGVLRSCSRVLGVRDYRVGCIQSSGLRGFEKQEVQKGFGFRFRFRVSGFGFRVSGFGLRFLGLRLRVSGFGVRMCACDDAETPVHVDCHAPVSVFRVRV